MAFISKYLLFQTSTYRTISRQIPSCNLITVGPPPRPSPTLRLMTTSSAQKQPDPPSYIPRRPRRDLNGKSAIVTGAGSLGSEIGNGRATSLLLAADGASVVCVDKNLGLAEHTVSMIENDNHVHNKPEESGSGTNNTRKPVAVAIEADVTVEQECRHVVEAALSKFGRVDILVNVVGIMGAPGTAVTVDTEQWAESMRVNVTSMMLMAKYAIPAMLRNTRTDENPICGSIVNIGSVAGLRGGTPHLLYPTSKGAVVNMTRAMAAHHGHNGIRVNCVCPGMMYTPMIYHGTGMSDEMREARKKRSILQTEGNAWDCASAIRFLAGDEARWITGAVLTVDAGATAAVPL